MDKRYERPQTEAEAREQVRHLVAAEGMPSMEVGAAIFKRHPKPEMERFRETTEIIYEQPKGADEVFDKTERIKRDSVTAMAIGASVGVLGALTAGVLKGTAYVFFAKAIAFGGLVLAAGTLISLLIYAIFKKMPQRTYLPGASRRTEKI